MWRWRSIDNNPHRGKAVSGGTRFNGEWRVMYTFNE
jgi:hypothetical protein